MSTQLRHALDSYALQGKYAEDCHTPPNHAGLCAAIQMCLAMSCVELLCYAAPSYDFHLALVCTALPRIAADRKALPIHYALHCYA